jgi:hypothetical protein
MNNFSLAKTPRREVFSSKCHPEGIYAAVGTAIAYNFKDPYRMT